MTSQQAKEILLLYRPGTSDATDPDVAEALALASRDPQIGDWLAQHCAFQSALQANLRRIPVPDGLKEQIVSEVPAQIALGRRRRAFQLAAALAALVLLIGSAAFWPRASSPPGFAAFRSRMARVALRPYNMDLATNDLGQIRRYLAESRGHGNFTIPAGLARVPVTGCARLTWQNEPVSMICFAKGGGTPLWLFVINRSCLSDAPTDPAPRFVKFNQLMTASWSADGKTYLLAAKVGQLDLREYF